MHCSQHSPSVRAALSALVAAAALSAGAGAQAATIDLTLLSATSGITNAAAVHDGVSPANGTDWQTDSGWWTDYSQSMVFQFDQAYQLSSAVVTMDWNDVYKFEVSTDGTQYTPLFVTSGLWNQQGSSIIWGQVTMPVSFAATAQAYSFLRVSGVYGDSAMSIGEISLQGVAAAVPEPESWALMAAGLGMAGLLARRRRAA